VVIKTQERNAVTHTEVLDSTHRASTETVLSKTKKLLREGSSQLLAGGNFEGHAVGTGATAEALPDAPTLPPPIYSPILTGGTFCKREHKTTSPIPSTSHLVAASR
jgi:hypothetical protein